MITKFKIFESKEELSIEKYIPKKKRTRSSIESLLGDVDRIFYHIKLGDTKVGTIEIAKSDDYIEIISQYVDGTYRGKGYGEKAVKLLKEEYPKQTFITWATTDSEKFWREKAKFSKMSEKEFDDINLSDKEYSDMYKILK